MKTPVSINLFSVNIKESNFDIQKYNDFTARVDHWLKNTAAGKFIQSNSESVKIEIQKIKNTDDYSTTIVINAIFTDEHKYIYFVLLNDKQ
ncbi:MAG: hypothetical protein N2235_02925 [Fischerella sp.]|nr:hypothetical protein [Fischerella sp.]